MEFSEEDIQAFLDKLDDDAPPKLRKMLVEALKKIRKGENPGEALQVSSEEIQGIIEHANNLFQGGKYESSLNHYQFLHTLEPSNFEHVFSVGICYYYLGQYDDAVSHYMACSQMDPLNPLPHVQLSNCFVKQGYLESALLEIYQAIETAKLDQKYENLREKAQVEREKIEKEILQKRGINK